MSGQDQFIFDTAPHSPSLDTRPMRAFARFIDSAVSAEERRRRRRGHPVESPLRRASTYSSNPLEWMSR